jgi:hypothetical protein
MAQFPLLFCSPSLVPLCLPFVSPFTYLAPSSCDRNCPPRSQVACKLTPFTCPSPNPPLPSKFPEPYPPSTSLRRPREYSGSCYPEQWGSHYCYLVILVVIEMDLVRVGSIRVGDEELIGGQCHPIQTKLFPLPLDPCCQPSWKKTVRNYDITRSTFLPFLIIFLWNNAYTLVDYTKKEFLWRL